VTNEWFLLAAFAAGGVGAVAATTDSNASIRDVADRTVVAFVWLALCLPFAAVAAVALWFGAALGASLITGDTGADVLGRVPSAVVVPIVLAYSIVASFVVGRIASRQRDEDT
jgi:hypothetical protein